MYGISFYTQSLFLIFLLAVTGLALYMGLFHAHRQKTKSFKKIYSASLSAAISVAFWYTMASWTYFGW